MTGIPQIQAEREIITERLFNFPISLVFKAWSDPAHLKIWWGPEGFTNTFEVFDFRPGGKWKFVMHGPDKGNYNNEVEFIEISEPDFIYWKRHSKPLFNIAVIFDKRNPQETYLTLRMIFETEEECNKLKKYVVDKNEENFDRLEKELARMT